MGSSASPQSQADALPSICPPPGFAPIEPLTLNVNAPVFIPPPPGLSQTDFYLDKVLRDSENHSCDHSNSDNETTTGIGSGDGSASESDDCMSWDNSSFLKVDKIRHLSL